MRRMLWVGALAVNPEFSLLGAYAFSWGLKGVIVCAYKKLGQSPSE